MLKNLFARHIWNSEVEISLKQDDARKIDFLFDHIIRTHDPELIYLNLQIWYNWKFYQSTEGAACIDSCLFRAASVSLSKQTSSLRVSAE